jgi:biotin transport system substrate-specific component
MSVETDEVELVGDEAVVNVARAALFAALIGGCAYVSFPNPLAPSVPVTLQVLALFLAGIYLGPVWGTASMTLYLAAGAAGAPVFSGGAAGVGVLLGPTGGYLWSYPVAAAAIGLIVHRGRSLQNPKSVPVPLLVGALVVGTAIVYAFGSLGLYLATPMTLLVAIESGSAAFVPFEAIKIAAAVGIVKSDEIAAA